MVTQTNNLVAQLRQRWKLWTALALVLAVGVAATITTQRREVAATRPSAPSSPKFLADLPQIDEVRIENPGFVGPHACAECHAKRVDEFRQTRHFQAMAVPDASVMAKAFSSKEGTWQSPDPSRRFEMRQTDGKFTQTAVSTSGRDEQWTTTEIAFLYGANAGLDDVYFGWRDDNRLFELPVSWLHNETRWGQSPFDPSRRDHCAREATPRCLECHATWFEHIPGSFNQYVPESFQLGVTCEKCHGPGREHVDFHRANKDAKTAKAITHPGKFSREQSMDLCAQCHSNAMKYRQPPLSYRPGQSLDDYFLTLQTAHPEEDHVANQQYVRESKCYQQSEMTCVTCHSPHHVETHHDTREPHPSCVKCHEPSACKDHPNLPREVRNDCIGCHMPQKRKVQVFFHTDNDSYVAPVRRWEHRIAVYPEAKLEVLWNWYRSQNADDSKQQAEELGSQLVEHWEHEGDSRLESRRLLAAMDAYRNVLKYRAVPEVQTKLRQTIRRGLKKDELWYQALGLIEQNRYSEALPLLEQCREDRSDEARVLVKLGTVQAARGDRETAAKLLNEALRYDPNESGGETMLGWLAYLDGNSQDALQHFRAAEALEPRHVKLNYQIALALTQGQQFAEAKRQFEYVLTLAPNLAQAYQGLSDLERRTNGKGAIPMAQKAVALSKAQDPYLLITLAEAYLADQQLDTAQEVADFSLAIAESRFPAAVPQIRALQRSIRNAR